jgi:cell division protein FtsN
LDQKRRLFIYDRKEVGVLILLGVGVALFAFTLGVHLGKQVVPKPIETAGEAKPVDPVHAEQELPPSRVEINQEVKNVPGAVDETLDQSLRDEIAKSGLQVDKPRQVELPDATRPETGAAEKPAERTAPKVHSALEPKAAEKPKTPHVKLDPAAVKKIIQEPVPESGAAAGRYTLQVGSYPSLREAEPELLKLNENGLRGEVREVDLAGRGKWFRLFVGQFPSIKDAERAGKNFKKERRISDFVVVRSPESAKKN